MVGLAAVVGEKASVSHSVMPGVVAVFWSVSPSQETPPKIVASEPLQLRGSVRKASSSVSTGHEPLVSGPGEGSTGEPTHLPRRMSWASSAGLPQRVILEP